VADNQPHCVHPQARNWREQELKAITQCLQDNNVQSILCKRGQGRDEDSRGATKRRAQWLVLRVRKLWKMQN